MVHALADEVFRAGCHVEAHQGVRIELLRLPQRNEVLVTALGRVSVVLEMVGVERMTGDVDPPRVPITRTPDGLRASVRPDAKFGVTKPSRRLIGLQRVRGRLKRTVGNG